MLAKLAANAVYTPVNRHGRRQISKLVLVFYWFHHGRRDKRCDEHINTLSAHEIPMSHKESERTFKSLSDATWALNTELNATLSESEYHLIHTFSKCNPFSCTCQCLLCHMCVVHWVAAWCYFRYSKYNSFIQFIIFLIFLKQTNPHNLNHSDWD